jgi:hypothetical protein
METRRRRVSTCALTVPKWDARNAIRGRKSARSRGFRDGKVLAPAAEVTPDKDMHLTSRLLARALDRARSEWLAGDPEAWTRYTAGLARLEQHYQQVGTLSRHMRADAARFDSRPHETAAR